MTENDFSERYGPVALVTGASSGIGKAFAEALAAQGFDLVIVARRVERLEALAAQLTSEHAIRVKTCRIDLADPSAAQQMLDATAALDIGLVVSNAGFGLKGEFAAGDARLMAEMLMVNCNVPMQLAHGFIPRLRRRGKGGLIFTSSVEALIGLPYSTAYSATKALVNALGEGLWAELRADGIDVLTLCPGATDSKPPRCKASILPPCKMSCRRKTSPGWHLGTSRTARPISAANITGRASAGCCRCRGARR